MPVDHINYERSWKTSQILPFLANVALERISCNATQTGNGTKDYIRALVNSAPIPIPGCADGPDGSCAVANFTKFVAGMCYLLCALDPWWCTVRRKLTHSP
jgi:acid phosphatase